MKKSDDEHYGLGVGPTLVLFLLASSIGLIVVSFFDTLG